MGKFIFGFNEMHMEGLNNFMGGTMIATVSFGVASVANKDAFKRTRANFAVVWYIVKDKSTSTDFTKMR